MEQTNQTRETRIAEITLLQQQLQVEIKQNFQKYSSVLWCVSEIVFNISIACLDVTSWCLQESQQWLGRLIPDKQGLSDQLKQVQQNSLQREYKHYYQQVIK